MDYEIIIRPEARLDLLDALIGIKNKDRGWGLTLNYVLMKLTFPPQLAPFLFFMPKILKDKMRELEENEQKSSNKRQGPTVNS